MEFVKVGPDISVRRLLGICSSVHRYCCDDGSWLARSINHRQPNLDASHIKTHKVAHSTATVRLPKSQNHTNSAPPTLFSATVFVEGMVKKSL